MPNTGVSVSLGLSSCPRKRIDSLFCQDDYRELLEEAVGGGVSEHRVPWNVPTVGAMQS